MGTKKISKNSFQSCDTETKVKSGKGSPHFFLFLYQSNLYQHTARQYLISNTYCYHCLMGKREFPPLKHVFFVRINEYNQNVIRSFSSIPSSVQINQRSTDGMYELI